MRLLVFIVLLLLALPSGAVGSSILLYQDLGASSCNPHIPAQGQAVDLYVFAQIEERGAEVQSVSFRLDQVPTGWVVGFTPAPLAEASGYVASVAGVVVRFPDCRSSSGPLLLLGVIHVGATANVSSAELVIVGPNGELPEAVGCSVKLAPLAGSSLPFDGNCPGLAVESASWSAVRNIYR